jgi:hypothetical protein
MGLSPLPHDDIGVSIYLIGIKIICREFKDWTSKYINVHKFPSSMCLL